MPVTFSRTRRSRIESRSARANNAKRNSRDRLVTVSGAEGLVEIVVLPSDRFQFLRADSERRQDRRDVIGKPATRRDLAIDQRKGLVPGIAKRAVQEELFVK